MPASRTTAEQRRAHYQLNKAVALGQIERPDACEKCGYVGRATRDIHGHHDDYSRPLDVRWLCSSCHKRHHSEMRKAAA
jgi:ribosomal protein L44E